MLKFLRRDDSAFSWERYFRFTARLESGDEEEEAWTEVERRTREAVRGVLHCDISTRDDSGRFLAEEGISSSLSLEVLFWPVITFIRYFYVIKSLIESIFYHIFCLQHSYNIRRPSYLGLGGDRLPGAGRDVLQRGGPGALPGQPGHQAEELLVVPAAAAGLPGRAHLRGGQRLAPGPGGGRGDAEEGRATLRILNQALASQQGAADHALLCRAAERDM